MKSKPLSRRALLQGAGVSLALPLLEAMMPFGKTAWAAGDTPTRFAAIYFPHGTTTTWNPIGSGTNYQLHSFQSALEPFRADISFLQNINSRVSSFHPGLVAGFLTDHTVPKSGAPFQAIKSMDQYIADALQSKTRLRELVMTSSLDSPGEQAQSGVYGSNLSWSSSGTPATRYVKPSQIFDRLFPGGAGTTNPPPVDNSRALARKSILDFAKDSISRLNNQVGTSDKLTLDQYLTSVREVEKKIQVTTEPVPMPMASCQVPNRPTDGSDYVAEIDIKMDLLALAFQCDVTRVATFLLDPEPGQRNMRFVTGFDIGSHDLSHWDFSSSQRIPGHQKANGFYIGKLVRLMDRLKKIQESGGTALDNSIILFGSSNKNSMEHITRDLPLILAGRGGGTLSPGSIKNFNGASLGALHYTILKKLGVSINSFSGVSQMLSL